MGSNFPFLPIDFEWALQQCSATALPVILVFSYCDFFVLAVYTLMSNHCVLLMSITFIGLDPYRSTVHNCVHCWVLLVSIDN